MLKPQVEQIQDQIHRLEDAYRAPERVYIEAKLLPNYLAVSYFPADLFAAIDAEPVGSRPDRGAYRTPSKTELDQPTRRIVLAVPDRGIDALHDLMTATARTRTEQNAINQIVYFENISLPSYEEVLRMPEGIPDEQVLTWEAVLHPAGSLKDGPYPTDAETLERWRSLVRKCGGSVADEFEREVGGLTFVPIRIRRSQVEDLSIFNPLRVLRPMPRLRSRPGGGATRAFPVIPSQPSSGPISDDIRIAVFDGGVDVNEGGTPVVVPDTSTDLTHEPANPNELAHGTGVTGAVLYGKVEPGEVLQRISMSVDSYRVLPTPWPDLDAYWVLDRIVETVRTSGHHIVNLSLGPARSVRDDTEPDRWTSELDRLAWDNGTLFVVAAGNSGSTASPRVQPPADMVNGLSVGACDSPAPDGGWNRAPYSSIGPGRYGARIQPLGVQFGGTEDNPFHVLRADGFFDDRMGTSFAAPVTTHALAQAAARLPRVNVSVLRAFAVHFAESHRSHHKFRDQLGYGRQPLSYDEVFDCAGNEVTTLYVDSIARGDYMAYRIPVPDAFVGKVCMRVTLAYVTPVDPTEVTEYTRAALGIVLRPHLRRHTFRPPRGSGGKAAVLDLDSAEDDMRIKSGWTYSQEPVSLALEPLGRNTPEGKLRESGKWETMRRFKTKEFYASELYEPRIEISYMARRGGRRDNSPTAIPFAMLITFTGDTDDGIYDNVRTQFTQLRPAQRARGRIRTRGGAASQQHWY